MDNGDLRNSSEVIFDELKRLQRNVTKAERRIGSIKALFSESYRNTALLLSAVISIT